MVTAALKNCNFGLPMYEKLFVFSFMGGAVIVTEVPQFWTYQNFNCFKLRVFFEIDIFLKEL